MGVYNSVLVHRIQDLNYTNGHSIISILIWYDYLYKCQAVFIHTGSLSRTSGTEPVPSVSSSFSCINEVNTETTLPLNRVQSSIIELFNKSVIRLLLLLLRVLRMMTRWVVSCWVPCVWSIRVAVTTGNDMSTDDDWCSWIAEHATCLTCTWLDSLGLTWRHRRQTAAAAAAALGTSRDERVR